MICCDGTGLFCEMELKDVIKLNNAVDQQVQSARDSYIAALDIRYGYELAVTLAEDGRFHNSVWGDRTAGSDAEHRAAEWLAQKMIEVGLSDVHKVPAKCDRWQFGGAFFQIQGEEKVIAPHSYAAAGTPGSGIAAGVVYVGRGTAADYEEVDARGKIVLVDIDQRANWWITYPMLEAWHHGAAAIMSNEVGGFSQISGDALNAQDICGPVCIPCVSVSRNDAAYLKEQLAKGEVMATLWVDNIVETCEGATYNVIGRIAGKSSEYRIIVGAHYDAHFRGFQDDGCGVGLSLAMAKAMIDSGFRPENDIVFCLHGAEEWGASATMFDWTVGAWEMINDVYPDWQRRTLVFLNFELPAYEFANYTTTCSPPEMYSMLSAFAKSPLAPKPEGCFPEGVLTEGYPTYTYSDDFSYSIAGVPSLVNGFMLQRDMETVFPFYVDIYHSNFDTKDTYNENVMAFNAKYYGALAIYIDAQPALPLSFTAQCDRLAKAIDARVMAEAGVDVPAYRAALGRMREAAEALCGEVLSLNSQYLHERNPDIWAEGRALTDKNLALFKFAQDAFLGLMYERLIVPHEAPQENIALMEKTVDALRSGDGIKATDGYAWQINNSLEWYSMHFSPDVTAAQDEMLWGEACKDRRYWGANKQFEKAQVERATRALAEKRDMQGADFAPEIEVYERAIQKQRQNLKALADMEMKAINSFIEMRRST